MQTELHELLQDTAEGQRAQQLLRACVHCGFCNATCPTYLLTGNELDGPRGRLYLVREMFESGAANPVAQHHLDRCLTCRACETTCPSGVEYGEVAELGRNFVEQRQSRGWLQGALRRWIRWVVPNPKAFRRWATLGHWFRWLLPHWLRGSLPAPAPAPQQPLGQSSQRRVLVLQGCVQSVATPGTNDALLRLLEQQGFDVVYAEHEGCCGGLDLHLGAEPQALARIRANLDGLFPVLESVDAVVSTASGCGVTYKDYARLLQDDPDYGPKAAALLRKLRDVAEFVMGESLRLNKRDDIDTVAWHAPCTLQHGQQITGVVERLLSNMGYRLAPVADGHLCCGSAGSYSILQPELSAQLRDRKLESLQHEQPDVIATANVGCQMHLAAGSRVPVVHWLELLG